MNIFLDTSGVLAVLDEDDNNHSRAKRAWSKILPTGANLISNNYVLVETLALLQHRFGLEAVRVFQEEIFPILRIHWVDELIHRIGVSTLLAAAKRKLSLVDCVSFETMRQLGLTTAFTLDSHFHEQGFVCIP